MNPTLDYLATCKRASAAATQGRARTLALADAQAAPPVANAPYAGELALTNAIKPAMHAHAYFKKRPWRRQPASWCWAAPRWPCPT